LDRSSQDEAQFPFDRLDRLADRGLGDVQPPRGPTEVQLFGDRDVAAQLPDVHGK